MIIYACIEKIIENGFILLFPKGNSYCCRKSSARGPRFKVSSEGSVSYISTLNMEIIDLVSRFNANSYYVGIVDTNIVMVP